VVENIQTPYGLPSQVVRRASAGGTGANAATNTTTYLSGLATPGQESEDYPVAITDEGGRTRQYAYTELGQLSRATDLSGSTWWTNQYDSSSGTLTNILSPTGETLSYAYDNLDNVKTVRFGDGNFLTNYYNAENRLASNTLPSGVAVALKYDFAGRLTNQTSTLGETASFAYNGNDAVTRMTDNTGTTTNLYDAAGRLLGIDYPSGASVRYELDLLNRITAITNKASSGGATYVIRYKYDAIGNITNVVDPWGTQTSLEYDRVGRRTKRILGNAVVSEWQYNWKDQVTNITHKISGTTLASVAYERAPGGEPTKITREDGSYVILAYDAALRLTNEVYYSSGGTPQATNSYGYDASGTRIRLVIGGVIYTNAVSAGYRVTQVKTNGTVVETYDYDSGGRVTNIVRPGITLKLRYNMADQVIAVTNGATWVNYVHDATGRRTRSTNSAGTVRRLLVAPTPGTDLESPHLIANASGNVQQGYIYLGDEPLLRYDTSGAGRVYYLEDAMGTVIGLAPTGASLANTTRLFYDGFGNTRATNGPAPTVPTGTGGDFRFHGAWLETDSGLYNMRAREYDARVGRFTSRDPRTGDFRVPENQHPYTFANNNPAIYIDPTGGENLISLTTGNFIQGLLSTFRTIAVHEVKQEAKQQIAGAVVNFIVKELLAQYVPGGAWNQFLEKGIFAGNTFTDAGRKAFCSVLGDSEWADRIHFEVNIRNKGTDIGDPADNGIGCAPNQNWQGNVKPVILPGHSRPDFILGDPPWRGPGIYSDAYLVGDLKLTTSTLYHDYVKPKRNIEQFNAIRAFAKKHTRSHTAIFLVLSKDPKLSVTENKFQIQSMKRIITARLLRKGVIGGVFVIKD